VTVIIATYNRSALLRLAVESVLRQDFGDFEVWVVGDGCTDDSQQVVAALGDPRVHWLNLSYNSGSQAAPNNAGLERARGTYVAYLGHDDLWFPWHLASLVDCIERTGADFAYPIIARIGPDGVRDASGPLWSTVNPSGWLHRREIVAQTGYWRPQEQINRQAVDVDFLARMAAAGLKMAFCPRLTVVKFPSWWFPGGYAGTASMPQPRYAAAMRHDSGELEREALTELVIAAAREYQGPAGAILRRGTRVLIREQVSRLGPDRWPLSAVLQWRFQRQRRSRRKLRGLPRDP
jgi:GT2 family glycosyltransferase